MQKTVTFTGVALISYDTEEGKCYFFIRARAHTHTHARAHTHTHTHTHTVMTELM